jgi:ABC-type phosphate transport system substrate-binding protein
VRRLSILVIGLTLGASVHRPLPRTARTSTGSGATFPSPIYSAWFKSFSGKNKGVTGGGAERRPCRSLVRRARSARRLTSRALASLRRRPGFLLDRPPSQSRSPIRGSVSSQMH